MQRSAGYKAQRRKRERCKDEMRRERGPANQHGGGWALTYTKVQTRSRPPCKSAETGWNGCLSASHCTTHYLYCSILYYTIFMNKKCRDTIVHYGDTTVHYIILYYSRLYFTILYNAPYNPIYYYTCTIIVEHQNSILKTETQRSKKPSCTRCW